MRTLLLKVLRDFKARKWQFLAVTFLVFLGISLFGGLYSSYLNIEATYRKFYNQTNFEDLGVEFNPAPMSLLNRVKEIPGVKAVVGRLTAYGTMDLEGRTVNVKLVSIPEKNSEVDSVYIVDGLYPKGNEVLVLKKFADLNGICVGQVIHVRVNGKVYSFRVSGTSYNPEYVLIAERGNVLTSPKDFGVLFVPYRKMEEITGLKGKITEVHVTVWGNPKEILNRVEAIFKPYGIRDGYERKDQPSYKLLRMDLQGFREIALMFPSMLLFIAALAVYVLLSRIVMEQTGIIAVLRALGYSKRSVVLHYMAYAVIVGVLGTVFGVFTGYWISSWMTSSYVDVLNLPYHVSKIYREVLLASTLAGILTPLAAGVSTAKRIAEIEPAVAMKGIRVEAPIRLKLNLPLPVKLAVNNLLRNPKRTAYTVIGVGMGVVLILTSLSFVDSVNEMMHIQFDKIQRFDYEVACSNVAKIRALKDVREAYPVVETWITFSRNGVTKTTNLIGIPPGQDLYNVYDLNGKRHFPPPEGIAIPKKIADELGIAEGEVVHVITEKGEMDVRVSEIIPQPLVPSCYADLKELERLGFEPNWVIVKGGNENELKRFGDVVSLDRMRRAVEEMMSMMKDFFVFSVAFGSSLAFAEVFNTTTVNLLERRREIATLRMLGYTVGEVARILLIETLAIGVMGIGIGIPLGILTVEVFKMTYKSELFNMPFVIYPTSYVITVLTITSVLLVSLLPGIRYVAKMDIERVTREVTE